MNISYKMTYFTHLFLVKSAIFAIAPLFFAFYNGFSGQKTWEDLYFAIYALVITNVGLTMWLIVEQPLPMYSTNKSYNKLLPLIYK